MPKSLGEACNHLLIGTALVAGLAASPARACTTFLDGDVVGKCYDWSMGQGLVLINPRGLVKQALPMSPKDRPAQWRAAYSSVTFNQYGRELPNGGMNDAGLVVEVMWLDETALPSPDQRPTVNELQWIQYALDRWSSVAELATHAAELRVSRVSGRVHYLACDRSHACAAFEYVGGKLVVTQSPDLVVPVLTNNTFADSASRLRIYRGFGGDRTVPSGSGSLDRFVRAASLVRSQETPARILESVHNGASQWQILYDVAQLSVSWRTRASDKWKTVNLSRLAEGCDQPAKMLDIDVDRQGDVTQEMTTYAQAADRALVSKSLARMNLPEGTVERVVQYPERLRCAPE
jgi:penicillin V acylase-like amidase (Ntn superfamily)